MATIKYTIEFFSDWHCGSGLAAGADVDALVVKDRNGLPFVPGKTIKGLIREAVVNIIAFKNENKSDKVDKTFGKFTDKDDSSKGEAFFTNAELPKQEADAIVSNKLQKHLYRSVASTAINENGIARDHSLRKVEVVVPCTLEGRILDVPADMVADILDGLKYIKRIGVNRNRGLGRCKIEGKEENQ